ncbi:MAG: hypothetical protein LBR93_01100 [Treponema sp.]|jgi:hypothetical protein|nr:hypothetical protein [Treponema sp.]
MKKTLSFGVCAALVLLAALVFSGCPAEEDSIPTVSIKITGLTGNALSTYYSLSVFKERTDIEMSGSSEGTKLKGQATRDGFYWKQNPDSTEVVIAIPVIEAGDYVLVLGTSSSSDPKTTEGKMFITKTTTNNGKVTLNFDGTPIPFSDFDTNGGTGWTVWEIVNQFGKGSNS